MPPHLRLERFIGAKGARITRDIQWDQCHGSGGAAADSQVER